MEFLLMIYPRIIRCCASVKSKPSVPDPRINREIERNRELLRIGDLEALLTRCWTQEWIDLVEILDLPKLLFLYERLEGYHLRSS